MRVTLLVLLLVQGEFIQAKDTLKTEKLPGKEVFVDPAIRGNSSRITVWFNEQFLGDGKAYARRAKEFAKSKRRELRTAVMKTLKTLSDKSYQKAKKDIDGLINKKQLSNFNRHWIVNGFTCTATTAGIEALKKIQGVRAIFWTHRAGSPRLPAPKQGTFFKAQPRQKFDPTRYQHPFYARYLLADKVWKDFGIAGQGTLSVVHDFNFVFSDNLTYNLYRNPKETPDNGKDDDGNGLIDDVHGYNFLQKSPNLTLRQVPMNAANPRFMHGFLCAAVLCGTGTKKSNYEFGLAPEGRWAGVIAGANIEDAIEWAIEQGADTYSMSFSIPNLGEYRSHWRKVMEQGSFCGVCFVSGAGNFAQRVKVPVQMRVPEDIPHAVFAATGVQRDFTRTPFSSQGPVKWETQFYKDGTVDKPEVCAFNHGLPLLKRDGTMLPVAINGNSFAGPLLGGSIALMLSADPDLLPWDVREILISTAFDVANKGYDHQTGHGLINCYRAVKEVLRRKAIREEKDAKPYQGRTKGDELDLVALKKTLIKRYFKVTQVQPRSQAAKMGLKLGDIFISYNKEKIDSAQSLRQAQMKARQANLEKVTIVIERGGKQQTVEITPGPIGIAFSMEYDAPVFK